MDIVLSQFVSPEYGIQFPVKMIEEWSTDVVTKGNGLKEQRNEEWPQPKRHWHIDWPALSAASRARLIEVFNRGRGRGNTFLWMDTDDLSCSGQSITTDGSAATYQLIKTYYTGEAEEWTENKKDIVPGGTFAPVVTHSVDGAQTEVAAAPGADEYTLDDATGIMTWSGGNEPSGGTLTVAFHFYFRVRWTFDNYMDEQFVPDWYRMGNSGPHIVEVVA